MSNSSNHDQNELLNNRQNQQDELSSVEGSTTSSNNNEGVPGFEEQPCMRSIAINPLTQHQRTLHFEPPLRRVDPTSTLSGEGGGSVGELLRGVSQPELTKTTPLPRLKQQQRRSKSESSLVRKWHVHATLPTRSNDFPPVRTSRIIHGVSAHVISNRISDTLQLRSIKTRFSKTHDNVAKCRNTDFCKFTIRLYIEPQQGGVLVEVQRLCGDAVSFMKDCRAVLNSAEDIEDDMEDTHDETPMYLRLPVSQMKFAKSINLPPISLEEEADSVNVTAELLASRMSDSNMLGMESLVIQTDPLRTMKSTAILASRRVLCPQDPGNQSFNMHNYVMSLLIYNDEQSDDSPSLENTSLADYSAKRRNLAMSALSNALSLLSGEKLLQTSILPNQEWYTSVLVPKLIEDLNRASNHPHDACYASRCLSTLAECSTEFAIKMKEKGGQDAIKTAENVGAREFALLARDAGSCRKICMSCCV